MNLFEVTDEFNNPKHLPADELKHLEIKDKRIRYELKHVRDMKAELEKKIVGNIMRPTWNTQQPDDPSQQQGIEDVIKSGYTPIYIHDHTSNGDKRLISMFIPSIPQNEDVIKRLQRIAQRDVILTRLQRDIPVEIKRAKGRHSAWKRKQPNYVGRATGKELLTELKGKVEKFLEENGLTNIPITNSYYWAKNKMIVIELNVRVSAPGMTINQFAKTVKVKVDKFMVDQGYTGFRVTDRYIDNGSTIVKIQLDDVEAKNKAADNETE
jgi:hypothetical protein